MTRRLLAISVSCGFALWLLPGKGETQGSREQHRTQKSSARPLGGKEWRLSKTAFALFGQQAFKPPSQSENRGCEAPTALNCQERCELGNRVWEVNLKCF